jgi:hypothetical protein
MLRRDLYRRNLLEQPRQFLGMVVIVLQARDMVLQRVDAGGSEDTRLAHGSSVHATKAPCAVDDLLIARDQQGSHGCAKTL